MNLREHIDRAAAMALERSRRAVAGGLMSPPAGRLLFATITGDHVFGFPAPDSELDLRGAHVLPLETVVGLHTPQETWEPSRIELEGVALDRVSHDVRKLATMLTGRNGYLLEQLCSPLVVIDHGHLDELRALAVGALTWRIVNHYRSFFRSQERLVEAADQPTMRQLLDLFRVGMTGLHLLREQQVEVDILRLNEALFRLEFVPELVERALTASPPARIEAAEARRLIADAKRLESHLAPTAAASGLPDEPPNLAAVDAFVVRMRLHGWSRT